VQVNVITGIILVPIHSFFRPCLPFPDGWWLDRGFPRFLRQVRLLVIDNGATFTDRYIFQAGSTICKASTTRPNCSEFPCQWSFC